MRETEVWGWELELGRWTRKMTMTMGTAMKEALEGKILRRRLYP
jgi:hypothetical protein